MLILPRAAAAGRPALGRRRAARRRADLLVQQRHQGRDLRGHRASRRCTDGRRASRRCTKAGTGCGGCVPLVTELLEGRAEARPASRSTTTCASTSRTRARSCSTWSRVDEHQDVRRAARAARHGPRLRDLQAGGRVDPRHRAGTSTCSTPKHRAAAGHQRPLPRQHPARRHLLGRAARAGRRDHARQADRARRRSPKKYGLYTKITGGQRIDLFGARVEQLPPIWEELVAAGFESGHAYGKALRTVK